MENVFLRRVVAIVDISGHRMNPIITIEHATKVVMASLSRYTVELLIISTAFNNVISSTQQINTLTTHPLTWKVITIP